MFLMGIFWYHLYDMSNYKLCNLDTYNHNFGSRCGTDGADFADCVYCYEALAGRNIPATIAAYNAKGIGQYQC